MKSLLLTFISLTLALPALASNNPDAGKLVRLVCYGVRTPGDLSTRDPNFTIIAQLSHTEESDASHYLAGNDNYRPNSGTPMTDFQVSIYKNTQSLSQETEVFALSEALLQNQPTLSYEATGNTRNERMGMMWADGFSAISYSPNNQVASRYFDDEIFDARPLYCEPPFSVEDPNNPVAEEADVPTTQGPADVVN